MELLDDAEAVRRSLDGDLDAFEALVERYTLPAHRTAYLLGAGDEAQDAVQEAFVKAFRNLHRFRTDAPFKPWLLQIVANETRNLHRSRARRQTLALRAASAVEHPVEPAFAEHRTELLAAVRDLPERDREVVVCRYFLELTEEETARVLGWPKGTVKSRLSRALERLRMRLAAPVEAPGA